MKKTNLDINKLVKQVIEESLQEKADELTSKVKSKMEEWTPNAPVTISGVDVTGESMVDEASCKYHMENFGPDDERTKQFCGEGNTGELEEKLHGGQKKLDKNKNGKLDKEDFEMLRKGEENEQFDIEDDSFSYDEEDFIPKRRKQEDRYSAFDKMRMGQEPEDIDWEEVSDDEFSDELDEEEVEEGNAFTGALAKAKESGKDEFEVGGKKFHVKEAKEKKFIQKAVKKMEKKGTEGSFKEYCGGEVTKSCIDKAMKSGDAKLIKKANFAKNIKAYKGAEHKKKSVKESLELTESELIDLIEKIVMEEKKPVGLTQTEKVLSADKKENEDYIKMVTKKMKDYLKDGSKGTYEMSPKHFPRGNGELAKMDKKTYSATKSVEEYVDNFTAAGLENLVYDEIHPNEDWVDKNIEGSSETGNNPKWANADDTGVNKKRNKVRKDNLLGAVKAIAYNKAPQPAELVKTGPAKKFEKNFGKNSGAKATKILNQLESTEVKNTKLLNEEFNRINQLMGYTKKTQ